MLKDIQHFRLFKTENYYLFILAGLSWLAFRFKLQMYILTVFNTLLCDRDRVWRDLPRFMSTLYVTGEEQQFR